MEGKNEFFDSTIIDMIFHDGYSFRGVIEYLKILDQPISMVFSSNAVILSETSCGNKILNNVIFYANELVSYKYVSPHQNYRMTLDTTKFYNEVKSIQKKKSLRLSKSAGDNSIRLQILDSYRQSNNNGGTLLPLEINRSSKSIYDPPKYKNINPVCTVPVNDFCSRCKNLSGCDQLKIFSSNKGVAIYGINLGSTPKLEDFGSFDPNEDIMVEEEKPSVVSYDFGNLNLDNIDNTKTIVLYSGDTDNTDSNTNGVTIQNTIMKALLKLSIISNNGTIKFYIDKEYMNVNNNRIIKYSPIGIICHIGTYGMLSVFIREN